MENKKTREEHIADWESSRLSKSEYAKKNGLAYSTFKGWVYRKEAERVDWKPISIQEDKEESKSFFELRIGDNWKIEIDFRFRL